MKVQNLWGRVANNEQLISFYDLDNQYDTIYWNLYENEHQQEAIRKALEAAGKGKKEDS